MTKSYTQLMKQIAKLQGEAKDIRRQEVQGVILRIKEAIEAYGLTAADLGLRGGSARVPKAAAPARKRRKGGRAKSTTPKYRDDAGNTWVGLGKRPNWLRDALAAGRKLEDFEIR